MKALDDKMIEKLAGQLGISGGKKQVEEKMKQYEGKTDDELVAELLKLQKTLNAANIPYEQQVTMVESMMPMMNGHQKARLKQIIGLLKR